MPKCFITGRLDTKAPCTNDATTVTSHGKPICDECVSQLNYVADRITEYGIKNNIKYRIEPIRATLLSKN